MIEPATLAPETQVALLVALGGPATTSIVRSSFPPQGAASDDQSEDGNSANVITGSRPGNLLDFSLISILQGQGPDTETESRNPAANQNNADSDDDTENSDELTAAELRLVAELQTRDREVRAHEKAHQTVGGSLTGDATFELQTGPDGKRYAIGGEVSIDASPEDNPEDTISKLERVIRAANAPAQPSDQDRAVVAQANATQAEARVDLRELEAADRDELRRQQAAEINNTAALDTADNDAADNDEGVQLEQLGRAQDPSVQSVTGSDGDNATTNNAGTGTGGFVETASSFTQGDGFTDPANAVRETDRVNPAFGAANPFEPLDTFSGIIV